MGTGVVGPTNPAKKRMKIGRIHITGTNSLGDAPIGGHDQHRGHVTFQCSIQKRETFYVQHVHLVHK